MCNFSHFNTEKWWLDCSEFLRMHLKSSKFLAPGGHWSSQIPSCSILVLIFLFMIYHMTHNLSICHCISVISFDLLWWFSLTSEMIMCGKTHWATGGKLFLVVRAFECVIKITPTHLNWPLSYTPIVCLT